MPGRFEPAGNVAPMKADSEFLGAEDIIGRGGVWVRVAEVLTYPKGYVRGGTRARLPFPVLVLEAMVKGEWKPTKKRWIVGAMELKQEIAARALSYQARDWRGLELELYAKWGVQSPKGGKTYGVRVRPTPDEQDPEQLHRKLQRAADRFINEDQFEHDTYRARFGRLYGPVEPRVIEATEIYDEPPDDADLAVPAPTKGPE